ncbi:cyclin-like protein [Lentinula edodes]|uniref:cyclin-like protein n=1 Tax=Lentinula edodes TaxID=5353 RepID=UPI001E8CD8D5|nr:cyclin-like protein [Lentinula edodes]KAH7880566.1 cyclin-like protein [Lentinula edodes]
MPSVDAPPPSPMKRPLYESSTQYKNWRYSPERLSQIRSTMNEAAVGVIRKTFEAYEPGSSSNVSFVNAHEEHLLVTFYVHKISQLCGHFRFPEEVEATATSYLKRFYLKNTVMDWHPKSVMLTALFLATKTTNNPISLDVYASHIPNTVASDVLDLEFLVAQSLAFEFAVWHTHRALWGIWLDIQNLSDSLPDISKTQGSIYESALIHVRAARLTDAEFIYTPSQIALACISLTAPDLAKKWLESKENIPLPENRTDIPPRPSATTLFASIEAIKSIITNAGKVPDVEAVREVDRRLRTCKNPEKVVGTKAYLARKAEAEKKAEEKKNKKAEIQKASGAADTDPFGDPLSEPVKPGLVDYDDDDDDD